MAGSKVALGSPARSDLYPPAGYRAHAMPDMTAEAWADLQHNQDGCGGGLAYEDGKIVLYSPPVYQPP